MARKQTRWLVMWFGADGIFRDALEHLSAVAPTRWARNRCEEGETCEFWNINDTEVERRIRALLDQKPTHEQVNVEAWRLVEEAFASAFTGTISVICSKCNRTRPVKIAPDQLEAYARQKDGTYIDIGHPYCNECLKHSDENGSERARDGAQSLRGEGVE